MINDHTTFSFSIRTSISQNSFISLILYLFYNADLLDICEKTSVQVNDLDFVDDVNLLVYDKSIEENCETIEKLHRKFETWARKHECIFASTKYQLIHLSRNSKKFNMSVSINIVDNEISSQSEVKVLDLHINTALKWESHVKKIQKKMIKQTITLIKISTFIWRATLKRARRVYTAIIRSTMIYELTVWHIFKKIKKSRILNKLIIIQNKCLRVITEIFKVTSIAVLETKSHVVSITNHLNQLQMNVKHRLTATDVVSLIKKLCQKIAKKLREIRDQARTANAILEAHKREWVNKLQIDFIKRISLILSLWMNIIEKQVAAQLKTHLEWPLGRDWDNFFDPTQSIGIQSQWVKLGRDFIGWVEIPTREWRISRLVWSG